jgi:hypothetical protein
MVEAFAKFPQNMVELYSATVFGMTDPRTKPRRFAVTFCGSDDRMSQRLFAIATSYCG